MQDLKTCGHTNASIFPTEYLNNIRRRKSLLFLIVGRIVLLNMFNPEVKAE